MKLRSASLYYAIVIALLIALTCTAFISFIYFQLYEHQYYDTQTRLINEAYSGIELAKSKSFLINETQTLQFSSLHKDSLLIKKMKWGIYDLIYVKSYFKKTFVEKCALLGVKEAPTNQSIALYVSNNSKSIGVSGSIEIIGDAYIAENGFKRNYIETKQPMAINFHRGKMLKSESELIPINQQEVKNIITNFQTNISDSIIDLAAIKDQILYQSFSNQTVLIYSNNTIYLNNIALSGNIKIRSKQAIIVGKNAKLNQVILIAKQISLLEDAEITAQLIASDSVYLGEHVKMNYPSSIFIHVEDNNSNKNRFLVVSKNTFFKGEIFLLNNNHNLIDESFLFIDEGCNIEGAIYSQAYTCIYGEIDGSAFIDKLLVKNTSAVYQNQLLNCKFDKSKQHKEFLWSPLLNSKTTKSIIQWLD